ncbi:low molecular weight phosphatase family protein [Plantibacter sp. M259]|uniref:arsenate reductase/protein-tyrosine-phosphatase family protein n=1 Tax=Plantibacter sp. M259 TaxID=2583822 RepID=UPI001110EB52|nr:low molecular weight phosphatase family protein [Plantibacter sp. M259]
MNTPLDPPLTRILIVCTGNVCRSPYAEFLLTSGLAEVDACGFEVRSAGTGALRGHPIDASSAAMLGPLAATSAGFTATQLTADLVSRQDVILTMTREHRSAVLRLCPEALRRTFSLREFARLLDTVDSGRLPRARAARWMRLAPALAANRTSARLPDPTQDDVVDPFGQGPEVFRRMASQIIPAVERIIAFERTSVEEDSEPR